MRTQEHTDQSLLVEWARWQSNTTPELDLLFSIPNGVTSGNKIQRIRSAMWLKASGVKRGVPDLFLPMPRGRYHGLFIEMKAKGGRLSPEQKEWQKRLVEQNYCSKVCFGFDDAKKTIQEYLTLLPV